MIDLPSVRDALAQRRAGGNYQPLTMTLTLKPREVRIDAVSADGTQVFVKYDDGTTEALKVSEIETLA